MGKVVLILAVVSLGLGLTSLHLVNQVREGDAAIAELQAQVASLQEQAAAPRPAATFSIMPGPIVAQAIEQPRNVEPAATKDAPKTAAVPQVASAAGAISMLPAPPSREESMRMMREHRERQRQLMQDPEYRDAMRVQSRSNFARQYPGVIQELGLDPQQADEFFEMLADQQMRTSEQMEPLWDAEGADPATLQARHGKIQQAASDMQRKNEAELASRFGQAKLEAWKEYQSTIGQRYQLEHMRSTLAAQGVPLSDDVSKPMLKALASAQKAEMDEYAAAASRGAAPALAGRLVAFNGVQGGGGGFNWEQQIESTRKRNQRTLDAISPYLNFEQRSAIEKEQEAQLKMMEAQQRLMRARGDGGSNTRFYSEGNAVIMAPTVPQ